MKRKGFTLIELLIVMAVVAVLAVAVVLVLNPAELLKRSRDSVRLNDLANINKAVSLFQSQNPGEPIGDANKVYVSLPSASADCSDLGLPGLPAGIDYVCETLQSYRNSGGSGWIPIDFNLIESGSPLSILPIDPVNSVAGGLYYIYVTGESWKLTGMFESEKYAKQMAGDGGPDVALYEIGTDLDIANFSRGLVGYWKFDEISGATAEDSSGLGNGGMISGNASWQAGKVNGAFFANSDGDFFYVNDGGMNSPLDLVSSFTISVWFKRDEFSPADGLLTKWDNFNLKGYALYFLNQYTLRYYINNSGGNYLDAANSVDLNSWYHTAITFNDVDKKMTIYVNGAPVASRVSSGNQNVLDSDYRLEERRNLNNLYTMRGFLDEVRIYNRALRASEIKTIYDATK